MTLREFYDCTPRELFNFLQAYTEKREEDIEQQLEYTRLIMWAAVSPHIKEKITPSKLLPLKRDRHRVDLSPFENQELMKWNDSMDAEMGIK